MVKDGYRAGFLQLLPMKRWRLPSTPLLSRTEGIATISESTSFIRGGTGWMYFCKRQCDQERPARWHLRKVRYLLTAMRRRCSPGHRQHLLSQPITLIQTVRESEINQLNHNMEIRYCRIAKYSVRVQGGVNFPRSGCPQMNAPEKVNIISNRWTFSDGSKKIC